MPMPEDRVIPPGEGIPYIEVPMEAVRGPPPEPAPPAPRPRFVRENRCVVEKFLCCLSLSSGVQFLGSIDILCGTAALVTSVLVLVAHSPPVEAAIEDSISAAYGANSTSTTDNAADAVADFHHGLHAATRALPLAIPLGILLVAFGALGIKAGQRNDTNGGCCAAGSQASSGGGGVAAVVSAARLFAGFKAAQLVVSLFSLNLLHAAWAGYSLIVARSRFLEALYLEIPLYEAAAAVFHATLPHTDTDISGGNPTKAKSIDDPNAVPLATSSAS